MESPLHMTQALRRMPPSPAAIDAIMLNESTRPPFYPDTPEYTAFFIAEKEGCTALDQKLQQAAALSAPLRQHILAAGRTADRQGVFTTIILPNRDAPGETLIIKIRRSAAIGAGFGTFGGIVEAHEAATGNLIAALLRECREESSEILGDETADALLDIVQHGQTLPLFICRDDTHKIKRGWGWTVDANAHVTVIDDPADQQALIKMLGRINVTPDKHIHHDGPVETDGIMIVTLDRAPRALARHIGQGRAPDGIATHHYGHEALGEISGVEKAFAVLGIDYPVRWHYFGTPGILRFIAPKMNVQRKSVIRLMDAVLAAPAGTAVSMPDSAYRFGSGSASGLKQSPVPPPACG